MWNPFKNHHSAEPVATPTSVPTDFVSTRELLAEKVGEALYKRTPPFKRENWQPASIQVPEEWDSMFEMAAWANAVVTLVNMIANCRSGVQQGEKFLWAAIHHFQNVHGKDSYLAGLIAAMVLAKPLPPEHPVFQLPECKELSMHGKAFGRAYVTMEHIEMPENQRLEALSRLGRCLIHSTHSTAMTFSRLVENVRFVDTNEELEAAYRANI